MKNFLYVLLIFFTITSCTKELPFPEFEVEPVLVINSAFHPAHDFLVEVSSTIANNEDKTPNKVTNATVHILDDATGNSTQLKHDGNGYYALVGFRPVVGKNYSIEVSAPNFKTARSIVSDNKVPKACSFTVIDHELGYYKNTESLYLTIEINDDPTEENYYLIEVKDFITAYELTEINSAFGHGSTDLNAEVIQNKDEFGDGQRKMYLPDTNFSGDQYTLEFWWTNPILQAIDQEPGNYVECHVSSVSKIYYEYQKSLEYHKNAIDSDFSTPIKLLSNIDTGFGVFASFNTGGKARIDF